MRLRPCRTPAIGKLQIRDRRLDFALPLALGIYQSREVHLNRARERQNGAPNLTIEAMISHIGKRYDSRGSTVAICDVCELDHRNPLIIALTCYLTWFKLL